MFFIRGFEVTSAESFSAATGTQLSKQEVNKQNSFNIEQCLKILLDAAAWRLGQLLQLMWGTDVLMHVIRCLCVLPLITTDYNKIPHSLINMTLLDSKRKCSHPVLLSVLKFLKKITKPNSNPCH